MSELFFFCTHRDVALCLAPSEQEHRLLYYPATSHVALPAPFSSLAEAAQKTGARILVSRVGSEVRGRLITPSDGTPWYVFDLPENPDAVMLHCGGPRGGVLLPGSLSCTGWTSASKSFFRTLAGRFKRCCRRVKSYWVGPEALSMLRAGCRLNSSETASLAYDLREE